MARSKTSSRDALLKLREHRRELDAREIALRDAAAAELGKLLIECGAEMIEPAKLKALVSKALTLGIDPALARLSAAD